METPITARHTVSHRVQSKQELIIPWLQKFYNDPERIEALLSILSPESPISLRLIDFFVTNYTKKYGTTYMLGESPFSVHFQYKRELKAYSKHFFDPFCRRDRIDFITGSETSLKGTTIGQLNFFRWAIEKQVIPYIIEHAKEIEADMNKTHKEHNKEDAPKTSTGRRKRKVLCTTVTKHVTHHSTPVTVSFD